MTKNREKQNKKRKDRKKAALAQEDQDPVDNVSSDHEAEQRLAKEQDANANDEKRKNTKDADLNPLLSSLSILSLRPAQVIAAPKQPTAPTSSPTLEEPEPAESTSTCPICSKIGHVLPCCLLTPLSCTSCSAFDTYLASQAQDPEEERRTKADYVASLKLDAVQLEAEDKRLAEVLSVKRNALLLMQKDLKKKMVVKKGGGKRKVWKSLNVL